MKRVLLLTITIILVIVFLVNKIVREPFIRETFIKESFSSHDVDPTTTSIPIATTNPSDTFAAPTNVQISNITNTSFSITFNPPNGEIRPIQYVVLITRLDSQNRPDGAVRLIFSNELGSANPMSQLINQGEVDTSDEFNSDCDPCTYTFRNLDTEVKHKVGVMAIYENGSSDIIYSVPVFVTPGVDNIIPTSAPTLPEETLEETSDTTPTEDMLATADGSYVRVKQELGGYPDNLFLKLKTGPNDLNRLVKRQLAIGIVDANVHTKGLED